MTHCGSPQARAEGRRAYRQSAAAVAISTVRFLLLKMAVKLYRGTVNLSSEKRGTESPASTIGLSSERGSDLRNLAPDGEGLLARSAAEVSSDGFGVRDMEEVRDLIMNGQEPLRLPA